MTTAPEASPQVTSMPEADSDDRINKMVRGAPRTSSGKSMTPLTRSTEPPTKSTTA